MRAAWCERFGDSSAVTVREIPQPVPASGQALVRVRAAAVNFPDVLMVAGRYHVRTEPPFVPGTEVADLRPLPAGLDFVAGAAFRVTHSTAYHALVTIGAAQPGQVVAVLGAAG